VDLLVPPRPAPIRLDHLLVELGAARTRSQAKQWVDSGRVRIAGALVAKAGHLVRGGETVSIEAAAEPPSRPAPEDLPLSILYEDEWIVAIDKPAGMVVHPAPGAWSGTLVNALVHHGLVPEGTGGEENRPGIVHRLDKETSGVILVAKDPEAKLALSRAFHDRRVEKRYLAIVLGRPAKDAGVMTWAIGRHARDRQRMSIRAPRSRASVTRWRVIERFGEVSLVEARPETGRTHQIRVHLAALGHPVLADPQYGARSGRALPTSGPARRLARQALHAAELRLAHPVHGTPLELHAPLPEDLSAILDACREALSSRVPAR
jgi:23S rRNA pseudouridine1911/1915/1917 synthase